VRAGAAVRQKELRLPERFELRPPRADEADAIAGVLNAHSRALYGTADVTLDEVQSWLENPSFDVDRDMRIAVLPGGALAGYADVGDQADEHTRFWIDLRLHPTHGDEAVAGALLAAMEGRARELAGPDAVVRGIAASVDETERALYEANGYRVIRHAFRMEIALDKPPAPPEWPDGFDLRTFRPGDDEAVYEAHQDSFADHWGFMRDPYEEWRHWMLREPFDPSLWFLAEADGELAGVCLCRPSGEGDPAFGWVSVLGVRPRWRRRGLALALLRHTFAEYHGRGHSRVGLGVDAENVSGAVRLYERAGMRVVRRSDTYERPL
jgi:mycothiol synthase